MLPKLLKHTTVKLSLLSLALSPMAVGAKLSSRNDVQSFINQMVSEHQFNRAALTQLLDNTPIRDDVIAAISSPAEAKPWYQYRKILVTPKRVEAGIKFWKNNKATLERAEKVYGVPPEIIVGILGVETRYGQYKGKFPVLESLTTLAFNYPKRSKFFKKELSQYLVLTKEQSYQPEKVKGSYAGAMGYPQFIASSYRHYAVDFDNDGKIDLINNVNDAIGSIANYFKKHGWLKDHPITVPAQASSTKYKKLNKRHIKPKSSVATLAQKYDIKTKTAVNKLLPAALIQLEAKDKDELWLGFNNFYVITRYNHSPLYAMAVYQLSEQLREGMARS